jgi:hypothetical protein
VFEEGSPQQWIDLIRDLEEIWTQNSINGSSNRTSTIQALLKGKSLTAFETAFWGMLALTLIPTSTRSTLLQLSICWTCHGSGLECRLPSLPTRNPKALDDPRHEKAVRSVDLKDHCSNHQDQQSPSRFPTWIPSIQVH